MIKVWKAPKGGTLGPIVYAVLIIASVFAGWLLLDSRPFAAWLTLCCGIAIAAFLITLAKPDYPDD